MRILIISDTHGNDSHFMEIIRNEPRFDVLVHAGDFEGSESFYESYFRGVKHFVSGNMDYGKYPNSEKFLLDTHKVFLTHGNRYNAHAGEVSQEMLNAAEINDAEILIFGHTHVPVNETIDGVLCLNPGSLSRPRQNPRRPSYMVMTIDDKTHEISVELKFMDWR